MCFKAKISRTKKVQERMSKTRNERDFFYKVVTKSRRSPVSSYGRLDYPKGKTVRARDRRFKVIFRALIRGWSEMNTGIYVCDTYEGALEYKRIHLNSCKEHLILKVSAHKDDLIGSGSIGYDSFSNGHIKVSCFNKVRVVT